MCLEPLFVLERGAQAGVCGDPSTTGVGTVEWGEQGAWVQGGEQGAGARGAGVRGVGGCRAQAFRDARWGVQDAKCGVQDASCKVWGAGLEGCKVQGCWSAGCGAQGLRIRALCCGSGGAEGQGTRMPGTGMKVTGGVG